MKKILTLIVAIFACMLIQGQTVDEILSNYFENIGGKEKLASIKGLKMTAEVNQGGMKIPVEMYQMADGRQMTVISFQGNQMKQKVMEHKLHDNESGKK